MSRYNSGFYRNQMDGSRRSAAAVVPILMSIVRPASVVDLGCGMGTWLGQFSKEGVADVLGVDGAYIEQTTLCIPPERFLPHDLARPFSLPRTFDLALCLEVAEHLPEARAAGLVEDLVRLAPVVVFSAAVPGQGGTEHVNEQWPEYWRALFARHNYVCLDCLRPLIWHDDRVESWYRQNLLIYVRADRLAACQTPESAPPLSIVHPGVFKGRIRPSPRLLAVGLVRSILSRLRAPS
jgi:SAM-dependent methyltransferase